MNTVILVKEIDQHIRDGKPLTLEAYNFFKEIIACFDDIKIIASKHVETEGIRTPSFIKEDRVRLQKREPIYPKTAKFAQRINVQYEVIKTHVNFLYLRVKSHQYDFTNIVQTPTYQQLSLF
jgi:hypothetical protein